MLYKNGEWSSVEQLKAEMEQACEKYGGSVDEGLKELGYERWTRIGDTELGEDPIGLVIYRRRKSPEYYMQIDGKESSWGDEVYVESVIDLMDLLARWAPAVEAAAVVARGLLVED